MKKDWVRTLLLDAIERHFPVTLLRKKLEAMPLLCVPLGISDELVLVAPYVDFLPDGFEVVRQRDVSRIQEDGRSTFHGRIMQAEGVLAQLAAPEDIPLESFPELLQWLMLRGEPVLVNGKNGAYLLGLVEKLGKNRLGLRYIDAEGRTDSELSRIAYEDILSVAFGTRYLRLVAQYAEPPETEGEMELVVEEE